MLAGAGWYNGLGFLLGTAMVSFEIFVKAMPPSLSELKVLPSFCFAFKIPDDVAASTAYGKFHKKKICNKHFTIKFEVFEFCEEKKFFGCT